MFLRDSAVTFQIEQFPTTSTAPAEDLRSVSFARLYSFGAGQVTLHTDCKATIFDFDLTLANIEALHIETYRRAVNAIFGTCINNQQWGALNAALAPPESAGAGQRSPWGLPENKSCEVIVENLIHRGLLKHLVGIDQDSIKEIAETIRIERLKQFNLMVNTDEAKGFMRLVPHGFDLMRRASGAGKLVGIATGSPDYIVEPILRMSGVLDLVSAATFSNSVSTNGERVKGKPDPEPYQATLHKLNVTPAQAVAFEDNGRGLVAAINANIVAIARNSNLPKVTRDIQLHSRAHPKENRGRFTIVPCWSTIGFAG